ncbi:MAG TPA: acyl-ACP thioesterase domain-containing protein [Acidimicrobiales bacterium]
MDDSIQFVPRPVRGRRFTHSRRVRLADTAPDGALRVDGLARYLQDVATDDWADAGLDPADVWVVRRTAVRVAEGGRWPRLGERVHLVTWCGGIGAAWAERRSDLESADGLLVETVGLWVPLDQDGRPLRLGNRFDHVYGEACGGRRISSRVEVPALPQGGVDRPWAVRYADLDVVGHVNNAAAWAAVAEAAGGPVRSAVVSHHQPVAAGEEVSLRTTPAEGGVDAWLHVDGDVRLSARVVR